MAKKKSDLPEESAPESTPEPKPAPKPIPVESSVREDLLKLIEPIHIPKARAILDKAGL